MSEEILNEDEPLDSPPDEGNEDSLFQNLRNAREDLQPFGHTITLEVPGYKGLLGIDFQYIGTDVTEKIARKIARNTKSVNGEGSSLLASLDTLIAACREVMVRDNPDQVWRSIKPGYVPVKLDTRLSEILKYDARDQREVVLGLFGSEHAIIQMNVQLSRWLTDITRKVDEDFFMG